MVNTLTKPVTKTLTSRAKPDSGKPPKGGREDMERLEADYRAGILTTREIGQLHGISHARVSQYARQRGWTRDLSHKVKAAVAAKLAAPTLPAELIRKVPATRVTEEQAVEIGAQVITAVVLEHRSNIRKARSLAVSMLAELEDLSGDQESLHQAAAKALEGLGQGDTKPAKAFLARLEDVMALGARAGNLTQVVNVLDRSIVMERRAFDLDNQQSVQPVAPGQQPPDAEQLSAMQALRQRFLAIAARSEVPDAAT